MTFPSFLRQRMQFLMPLVVKYAPIIEAESRSYRYFPQYVGPDDVVVEVGAFEGGGTRLLSKLAKKVYSFEPHPFNFRIAKEALKPTWRGRVDNVTIQNIAIGRKDSTATLRVRRSCESDSLSTITEFETERYRHEIRVEMRSLDSLGLFPDVLIADCEGAEVDVVEGGKRALSNLKAAIIETHPLDGSHSRHKVEEWMKSKFSDVRVLSFPDESDEVPWVMGRKGGVQ